MSPSQDRVPNWGVTEDRTTVVGPGVGSAGKEGVQDGEGGWSRGLGTGNSRLLCGCLVL